MIFMESRVTATLAARTFSELLNRVRYRGEVFLIERGREPIGRLTPVGPPVRRTVADLVRSLRTLPKPDEAYLDAVERASRTQGKLPRSPWRR